MVAQLLDTRYQHCQRVTLVLDNLNTQTKGTSYEVFEPPVARAYVKWIEFVYTPTHGSWLNVAECELSAMTRQCLSGRSIGEIDELRNEISAWSDHTNEKQRGVDWQFLIDEARTKLARLYPKSKMDVALISTPPHNRGSYPYCRSKCKCTRHPLSSGMGILECPQHSSVEAPLCLRMDRVYPYWGAQS